MKGKADAGQPPKLPAEQHIDDTLDRQVAEYSKLYSIDKWLQPRSMVEVTLAKLKEETRCPMCFGKIRSARISMVCLHRYCAKCIEQYLRAKMPGRHGDEKECPVCRAHLHSRRATKPDPAFDKIIKALYGDVDQFDAEEEALIEADNKAHVKAWQEQLADMKARQAAAVAAAKAAGPLPASERKAGGSGMTRPASTSQLDAAGGGWEGGAAGSGKGSKKRSFHSTAAAGTWDDDHEEQEGELYGASGGRAAAGSSKGGFKAAKLAAAGSSRAAAGASGGTKRGSFAAAAAAGGEGLGAEDGGLLGRPVSDGLASMGSGGLGRKRKHPAVSVARLIGLAAQAAAAEGPPARFCVVQLVPEQQRRQQQEAEAAAAAAAAAAAGGGRSDARSRKQPKGAKAKGMGEADAAAAQQQRLQQLLPGEVAAPSIERPFLACPVACTVGELKKMLLQQLHQQGTTAGVKSSFEVQLVLGQQQGLLALSGGSSGDRAAVLGDSLTVGQLHERSGCLGPDVQLQYRLVGV